MIIKCISLPPATPSSIVIRVGNDSIALQVQNFIRSAMKDLLWCLATRVRRCARLAFAVAGLHKVVLIRFWGHIVVTVPQRSHRRDSSRKHADGVMRSLEGEFPIRYFVRIAASPTRLHADHVPATPTPLIRLRNPTRIFALVAAQLLVRFVRVFREG